VAGRGLGVTFLLWAPGDISILRHTKMQCSTSVEMGLDGMAYFQKMNTRLDACANMEK